MPAPPLPSAVPTSSSTRPPGRTSTAPRTSRRGRSAVNVGGTAHARGARRAARRVLDRLRLRRPEGRRRTSSRTRPPRSPPTDARSSHGEAAAGERAWIVRSSWLFGETGHNFVRTMLRLGAERDEVAVVDDQRGCPTYVGHLAAATRELVDGGAPFGIWHLAAAGDCTWAEFAEAIFEEAGLDCRVRRITRPSSARRRAPGVLGAPQREGRAGAPALARGPRAASRARCGWLAATGEWDAVLVALDRRRCSSPRTEATVPSSSGSRRRRRSEPSRRLELPGPSVSRA